MSQPNFYTAKTANKRDKFFKGTHANDGSTDYLVDLVAQCVQQTGAKSLLDLGTGNGYLAWRVINACPKNKLSVLGVDTSAAMLESFPYKNQKGLRFEQMDNLKLNLPNNSLDIVMAKAVTNVSIAEVHRILKPGGHFFYKEYSSGKGMVEVFDVAGIARKAGGLKLVNDMYKQLFSYVRVEYFATQLERKPSELQDLVKTMRLSTAQNQPSLLNAVKQLTKGSGQVVVTSDPFIIVARK